MRQLPSEFILLTVVFVVVGPLVLLLIAIDYAADSFFDVSILSYSLLDSRIATLTAWRGGTEGFDPDLLTPERLEA